jgi:hypothetical protein
VVVGRKKRNRKIGNGVGKGSGKSEETRSQTPKDAEPANLSKSDCGPLTGCNTENLLQINSTEFIMVY